MQAGKYNKRVTIEQASIVQDVSGQETNTWATLLTVWASIIPKNNVEAEDNTKLKVSTFYEVTIRYTTELIGECRILYGTKYLDIQSVINPYESDKELLLTCVEVG